MTGQTVEAALRALPEYERRRIVNSLMREFGITETGLPEGAERRAGELRRLYAERYGEMPDMNRRTAANGKMRACIIAEMVAEGFSRKSIAGALLRNVSTVTYWCLRLADLERYPQADRETYERIKDFKKLFANG